MNDAHRLPLFETKFASDFPEWLPARGSIVRRAGRALLSLAVLIAAGGVFLMIVGRVVH